MRETYNPGPDELPDKRRPPFPTTTEVDKLLGNGSTLDFRAGNTVRRMVLLAGEPHAQGQESLDDHAGTNEDHDATRIGEVSKTTQDGSLGAVAAAKLALQSRVSKLFL